MIATLTLSLISVVAPQLVQAIQAFGFSVSVTGKGCPPQNGQGLRWIFGFGGGGGIGVTGVTFGIVVLWFRLKSLVRSLASPAWFMRRRHGIAQIAAVIATVVEMWVMFTYATVAQKRMVSGIKSGIKSLFLGVTLSPSVSGWSIG